MRSGKTRHLASHVSVNGCGKSPLQHRNLWGELITPQQLSGKLGIAGEEAQRFSAALEGDESPMICRCPVCNLRIAKGEHGLLVYYEQQNGPPQLRMMHYNHEVLSHMQNIEVYTRKRASRILRHKQLLTIMLQVPPSPPQVQKDRHNTRRGRPEHQPIRRTLTVAHAQQ